MKASAQKMLDLSEKFNLPMALEVDAESTPLLQKGIFIQVAISSTFFKSSFFYESVFTAFFYL